MKKNQHIPIETPSFVKAYNKNQDDCDFSDDLIDQHVVTGMMPFMMSSRQKYIQQSSRALKSIQNIQNTYLHNNICYKQQNNAKNYNDKNYLQKANNYNYDKTRYKQNKLSQNKSQSRLQQNIQQHLTKKQKKIKDLKQLLQNKQMKQCTFTPKTHLKDKKEKLNKRDLKQFLKNQQEHVNKIQKKRQDMKKKVQQNRICQESFRPKINKSHKIQGQFDKKKQPAYQRLYLLKQNKIVKSFIDQQQKNMNSISKIENSGISINKSLTPKKSAFQQKIMAPNTLYEDAQRRQNLAKSIQKNKSQIQNFQSHYYKNKNNQKFSAQKFIKQYCYILQCLKLLPTSNISSSYTQMQADISFLQNTNLNIYQKQQKQKNEEIMIKQFSNKQFNDILRGLGFLIYQENSQSQLACQQKNLAYEGFQLLQQYGVNIRNVCVFLLSVLGIFNVNPIKFYDSISIGCQKNQLQITQKQGRKIHKHFDLLYRNHLNSANKSKKILHTKQIYSASPYSHSPSCSQIKYISPRHNQHTKQLASKYRTKMIQRANQRFMTNNIDIVLPPQDMLTHQDLLVIDNLGRNLQIKKIKQDKDNYIDKQCTFYPKTNNNYIGYSACHTDRDRGLQKSKQLYQHARSKQQLQKQQYQNNKYDVYQTFQELYKRQEAKQNNYKENQKKMLENKNNSGNYYNKNQPSTQRYTNKNNQIQKKNTNQVVPIRDVDKAVARMTLGRKQRQLKNKLLQRGQPDYSKKKQVQKSSKFSPLQTHQYSALQPAQHIYSTNTFATPDPQQLIQTDQHQQNNQPFLVIDVNMGQQTGQIQFLTGDEKKVGTIVDQFCIEHDLDQQCKQQLLQLVQIQMTKYLNNLGAQSTEY